MNFQSLFSNVLNIVFPPLCIACKKRTEEHFLCHRCKEKIEVNSAFYCPRCNRRLPELKNCPVCRTGRSRFILAAATSYQNEVVRELIHVFKYKRVRVALEPLTKVLDSYVGKAFENCKLKIENFLIVPIPLHPKKERERGFNQATLIAEVLLRSLASQPSIGSALKIEKDNLFKTKPTSSQTDLKDYEERTSNVEGCFALRYPEKIRGKNVLLVDDVFTSGATMREAVRTLKVAGAKKIVGFVIAKA